MPAPLRPPLALRRPAKATEARCECGHVGADHGVHIKSGQRYCFKCGILRVGHPSHAFAAPSPTEGGDQ